MVLNEWEMKNNKNITKEQTYQKNKYLLTFSIYFGLLIIFLFFVIGSLSFGSASPARAPIFVGSIGLALLFYQIYKKFREFQLFKTERIVNNIMNIDIKGIPIKRTRQFYFVLLFTLIYIILSIPVGYFTATVLFLFATIIILSDGNKKWIFVLLISISLAGAMYLIFGIILKIPLPRAIIW
jgi:hypothetical protein